MGAYAVDLLLAGEGGKMVVLADGRVTHLDIADTLVHRKELDLHTLELARVLSQ